MKSIAVATLEHGKGSAPCPLTPPERNSAFRFRRLAKTPSIESWAIQPGKSASTLVLAAPRSSVTRRALPMRSNVLVRSHPISLPLAIPAALNICPPFPGPDNGQVLGTFQTNPEVDKGGLIPDVDKLRNFDFRLSPQELTVFKRNGFVVSERLRTYSFAEGYYRVWNDDLPVFITTDSLLQAWHRSYDAMLRYWRNSSDLPVGPASGRHGRAGAGLVERTGQGALKESILDATFSWPSRDRCWRENRFRHC